MANNKPKLQDTLTEEERHRRLWLQYALQTPPPRPIKPASRNAKQATPRGAT